MQYQQSTQSILSKEIFPTFTRPPETISELNAPVNWSSRTIVSQGVSELERHWMVTGASTISVPQTDVQYLDRLHVLQRWYVFRSDRLEILHFLERYPFLVSLLVGAYYNILKYFPYSLVFLTTVTDPEEFGADQLIASIATDLGPDEATDALNTFDKNWWLNSLKRAQGKLCITLEFQ
jgi:hypothetical protein